MYARLLRRQVTTLPKQTAHWIRTHLALALVLLLTAVIAGTSFVLHERGRGHLSRLKSELKAQPATETPPPPQPGGEEAIVLQRSQMAGSTLPEFLSVTLLPGRGMNTLQITAYLPDRGEVQLLASPTVDEAATLLSGTGDDHDGALSLGLGGALEVPWAGRIFGQRAAEKDAVPQTWHGRTVSLPLSAVAGPTAISEGGLLLNGEASSVSSNVMPDGGEAQALYPAGDFNGRWPSKTEVKVTVLLSGRALEIHVVAHNTGTEPEPIGMGWKPRFAVLSGDRSQVQLHLPSSEHIEQRDGSERPTGRLLPVAGTPLDFTGHDGAALRSLRLDDTFVHLRPALLDFGPMIELRDPKSNYGLRVTAMTSTIHAVHIESDPGSNVISIDPRFNYDDPFGREWGSGEDTGMVTVEPGKSVQWRIRLELFPLSHPVAASL